MPHFHAKRTTMKRLNRRRAKPLNMYHVITWELGSCTNKEIILDTTALGWRRGRELRPSLTLNTDIQEIKE